METWTKSGAEDEKAQRFRGTTTVLKNVHNLQELTLHLPLLRGQVHEPQFPQ